MDEKEAAAARRETGIKLTALAVLLDRAGGRATYTQTEYRELAERYGGTANVAIHIEISKAGPTGEPVVELALIRKTPEQGSLVS